MNTIYTAGYAGRTPEQLLRAATSLKARVLDIRLKPFSRLPGWNHNELRVLLDTLYVMVPELGNAARRDGGAMRLDDPSVGMDIVRHYAQQDPVILLCGCADAASCHRSMVGAMLRAEGYQVQELAWPETEGAAGTSKALSLWQPWASLMAIGAKRIETRSWSTAYRGPLVIHAAKRWTAEEKDICASPYFCEALHQFESWEGTGKQLAVRHTLPLGRALGVCDLVECVPTERLVQKGISVEESEFGDYSPGRFGWVTENMRVFPAPVPMKGAQQIFSVAFNVEAALRGEEVLV